jgi:hypothetical protein
MTRELGHQPEKRLGVWASVGFNASKESRFQDGLGIGSNQERFSQQNKRSTYRYEYEYQRSNSIRTYIDLTC